MGALLIISGLLAAGVAAGALYQAAGLRRDARELPPYGRLVNVNGRKVHVWAEGAGSPPVVFEAGIAASSLSWRRVQPEVARYTSTYSYDRPGLAWSDRAAAPRTLDGLTDELRQTLASAGVPEPRIIAAHSFGALIALNYARCHPREVAGVVLVDPVSIDSWHPATTAQLRRLRGGILLSRWGSLLARVGVVRFALAAAASGSRGVAKSIAKASSGPASAVTERLAGEVAKLPPEYWPAIRAHWSNPRCFLGMADHLGALPGCVREATGIASIGDVPLIVLSGAHITSRELDEHLRYARLSTRGKQVIAGRGGHWIHLDQPELVVESVAELVQGYRAAATPTVIV